VIVLTGIALLGTVSAVLASWFVGSLKDAEDEIIQDAETTAATLADLMTEVKAIRRENAELKREMKRLGEV
jgi:ABC-type bacteriocin/lantibiotic exporter with double-glycine peptidase domain